MCYQYCQPTHSSRADVVSIGGCDQYLWVWSLLMGVVSDRGHRYLSIVYVSSYSLPSCLLRVSESDLINLYQQPFQAFMVDISEEFLDYLEDGALAVEVWGHRRSGFNDMTAAATCTEEVEAHRHKSFPER